MNKMILTVSSLLIALCTFSQQRVEWSFYSKKISDEKYEIHLSATVDKGWAVYSQYKAPNNAATQIQVTPVAGLKISDKFEELGEPKKGKLGPRSSSAQYFENYVDFVQVISIRAGEKPTVKGSISVVVTNGAETLPRFAVDFAIPVN